MEFSIARNKNYRFRKMHPLLAHLVQSLPEIIDADHLSPDAEARFYPGASDDPELDAIRSEWKAYVEPDLQDYFRSARDVVSADLKQIKETRGLMELQIAPAHAEAWLNALNQARLALAAEVGYDEQVLTSSELPDLSTEQGSVLFRINLYAFMQECLLGAMD